MHFNKNVLPTAVPTVPARGQIWSYRLDDGTEGETEGLISVTEDSVGWMEGTTWVELHRGLLGKFLRNEYEEEDFA